MNYQLAMQQKTLQDVLVEKFGNMDQQGDIPWIVRLLENPTSPLPFPGKISLKNHDCLHILLDREVTAQDEAFVVGFTMGNDRKTNWFHKTIFKCFSRFIYPKVFKFTKDDLKSFDLGFCYGRKLSETLANINQVDFSNYYDKTVAEVREMLGIRLEEVALTSQFEAWLQNKAIPGESMKQFHQEDTFPQLMPELVPST